MNAADNWVEFYFDPICPWAYQSSKWIREVSANNGVEVRWRFFSLHEVNRPKGSTGHDWDHGDAWQWSWSLMRVGAALRRTDMALLDRWYGELGRRFHEESVPVYLEDRARAVAEELGLGEELAAALADPTTNDEVRADHQHAVEQFAVFGVPALVFPGDHCLFGPKVTPAPTGAEAMKVWDIVKGASELPHLYQIRKPMTADDLAHIDAVFDPYYRARTWETVQASVDESSPKERQGDACAIDVGPGAGAGEAPVDACRIG